MPGRWMSSGLRTPGSTSSSTSAMQILPAIIKASGEIPHGSDGDVPLSLSPANAP
jgi:hypothetical protein